LQTVNAFLSTIEVWTEVLINTNIMALSVYNIDVFYLDNLAFWWGILYEFILIKFFTNKLGQKNFLRTYIMLFNPKPRPLFKTRYVVMRVASRFTDILCVQVSERNNQPLG
jgi:hypothetical protein